MSEEFTFEDQRPDEKVIFVTKQHPWVMSRAGFLGVVLIAVLIIAYIIFGFSKVTSLLLIIELIIIILYICYVLFLYKNNLSVLTDQRLIIIEQKGFFSRLISEAELDKIQNLTIEVKGMMKTVLNFGDIRVSTAGLTSDLYIHNVENPYKVQQQIAKYCNRIIKQPGTSQTILR